MYDILIGEDSPSEFNYIYESNNQLENQSIVFIVIVAFCKSQLSRWANRNRNQYAETVTHFIYVWDEKNKNFKLIKKAYKTYQTTRNDWFYHEIKSIY